MQGSLNPILRPEDFTRPEEKMHASGYRAGRAAGSWVIDGNTTRETAQAVLDAAEQCELEIPAPFSGEWADGWTKGRAYEDAGLFPIVGHDGLTDAWEDGFREGYEYQAVCDAEYQVNDGPNVSWGGAS
jgi:hypothetical protein